MQAAEPQPHLPNLPADTLQRIRAALRERRAAGETITGLSEDYGFTIDQILAILRSGP